MQLLTTNMPNHGPNCKDFMGKRVIIRGKTVIDNRRNITAKTLKVNGNVVVGNDGAITATLYDQTGWELYNKVRNATVSILVNGSACSGFFVRPNGWIVTAAHCLLADQGNVTTKMDASEANVLVTSVNGVPGTDRFLQATEVYVDAAGDIGVLKVPGLTAQDYLQWGNSQTTCIGNRCYVVGNPLGEDTQSLSDGLVRENGFVKFPQAVESIFISAPTAGGNSGSPVITEKCKVVGLISFGIEDTVEVLNTSLSASIGFAFPLLESESGGPSQRIAERVTDDMILNGADFTKKAWLGIDSWNVVNLDNASQLKLVGSAFNVQGMYLGVLDATSPLLSATTGLDLAPNDVILTIDGVAVGDLPGQTHITTVSWFKVKTDVITLTWIRPPSLTVMTSTITIAEDFSDHTTDDKPLAGNLNTVHIPKLKLLGGQIMSHVPLDQTFNDVLDTLIGTTYTYRDPTAWTGSEALLRLVASDYGDADGNVPSGGTRPNPRTISNAIFDQPGDTIANPDNATDYFWIWGQFVDHDVDLTEGNSGDAFDISIPAGDPDFDPGSSGTVTLGFSRSLYASGTGTAGTPREQITEVTSHMDATNVYGSTSARSTWLRAFSGGKLKTSQGNLPPLNDGSQGNAGPAGGNIYVCGDVRANENTGLLCTHTLFLREHNWWCDKIASRNSGLTDEQIYQKARVMVESEYEAITFNEFLPLMLGSANIPSYPGYDSGIDTTIANEFSSAAYRLGHSLVSDTLWRLGTNGLQLPLGHLGLKDAFWAPNKFANEGGIDPVIRGATEHICQALDSKLVPALRNFLFGTPGAGGLDLAALNIQRGRDHGFSDYNTIRAGLGLATKSTFAEISSDTAVAAALSTAYSGDISKIDLWVGGLCEDHYNSSMLGETFYKILRDQFLKLRDGDPLWYETRLDAGQIAYVNSLRLSDIIMRNTNITGLREYVMQK